MLSFFLLLFFCISFTLFVPFSCSSFFPPLLFSSVGAPGSAAGLEVPALLNAAGNLCLFLYLPLRGIGETLLLFVPFYLLM